MHEVHVRMRCISAAASVYSTRAHAHGDLQLGAGPAPRLVERRRPIAKEGIISEEARRTWVEVRVRGVRVTVTVTR